MKQIQSLWLRGRAHARAHRLLAALLVALLVMTVIAVPALAQSGVTVFQALGVQDGSISAPGYTFNSDFDTGWYRIGSGNIGYSANGTRVFDIGSSGAVTGYVLQYPTPGLKQVCATGNITSSTVLAHGLATPSFVYLTMAQDATGDGARLTFTNSAAVVTAKGWNSALTPAAATTPIAASWCVIGTP